MSPQEVHTDHRGDLPGGLHADSSESWTLPLSSTVGACARGADATVGNRPSFGQFRSPTLGPILAHAERRLADLEPGIGAMAEAIVAQQRAQKEAARG